MSNLKKNGGGAGGPGSDSFSGGQDSFAGGDKDERDAFWGLVRLFISCHEGENKDYKSEGLTKKQQAHAAAGAENSKSVSKNQHNSNQQKTTTSSVPHQQ